MAEPALLFIVYYALAGLVSYATPRFLIALGIPLDEWIVTVSAAALSLRMSREAAKWGVTLALGMALFGGAIFVSANGASSQKNITDVTVNPYRAQLSDDVLNVTGVPAKIVLPTSFPRGKTIIVKDGTGLANQSNILISVDGGAKISGLSAVAITSSRGSWSFIWDGKEWSFY
jgi:hypothetical protein